MAGPLRLELRTEALEATVFPIKLQTYCLPLIDYPQCITKLYYLANIVIPKYPMCHQRWNRTSISEGNQLVVDVVGFEPDLHRLKVC